MVDWWDELGVISAKYYELINEEVKHQLGGLNSAKCILYSVSFEKIERYQASDEWQKAGNMLGDVAYSLERDGADVIVLCTNTMHKVISAVEEKVTIPVLHIAYATATQIRSANLTKIGLLGTKYTMEQDFYKSRIEANGLEIIVPNHEDTL